MQKHLWMPTAPRAWISSKNADGSLDILIGPDAPAGKEANWIPTVPGKAWFACFRFYSPTDPYFDRSWVLTDIEKAG